MDSNATYGQARGRRRAPLLTALTVLVAAIWVGAPAVMAAAGPTGTPGSATPTPTPTPAPSQSPTAVPTATPVPKPVPLPLPPITNTKGLATQISLEIPTGSVLGKDVVVAAVLKDVNGARMAGQHLGFYLDGQEVQSDKTDANGQASFTIAGKRLGQSGDYQVGVLFGGIHGYAGSTIISTLTILNAAIQIVSVPPMTGLGFSLGSVTALTGPDGIAALPVPQSGTKILKVVKQIPAVSLPGRRRG